ncbi:MAG: hypothetical protein KGJ86_16365, partial [Chloroflexota bacterium]|nr:hypothetical protein [Chloroflexota bacterium]
MSTQSLVSDSLVTPALPNEADVIQQIARQKRRRQTQIWILRALILVVLLVGWQLAGGRLFPEFVVSSPSLVAVRLWGWLQSGYILRHLAVTLKETAFGFTVGTLIGCTAGILLGMGRFVSDVSSPYIQALY